MINKALEITKLLSSGNDWTVEELAKELRTTPRTVYRTLNDLERYGYVVDRNHGHPRLLRAVPEYEGVGRVINFTAEEQALLRQMVLGEDADNPLRTSLLDKLQQVMDNSEMLPRLTSAKGAAKKISTINQAIKNRRRAVLIKYESGSSNTVRDRRVEPVGWSANYRELHAYDVDKQGMRCFVVSRMKAVRLLEEPWQHEAQHAMPQVDCFWMTGEYMEEVTIEMSRLALNLLHEEFPLSRGEKTWTLKGHELPCRVRMKICKPQGAARFVMGMGRQCRVTKGKLLMEYIEKERK